MKIELHNTSFLTVSQIGDLTSQLDVAHTQALKALDRLHKDVATRQAEIKDRWQRVQGLTGAEKMRLAGQEISTIQQTIRANSKDELDRLFKHAGGLHRQVQAQKVHYAHKAQVLGRFGMGTERRSLLEGSAAKTRPVALANMVQHAIGTNDLVLAAVVLTENDYRRESDRAFRSGEALDMLAVPEFDKAHEFFKLADVRFQAVVLAVRTWTMGKTNPIDTVALGLRKNALEADAEDGGDE